MRLITLFFLAAATLVDASLPVDISFVIVDAKYNARQGIKICEVQHASLSAFSKFYYENFPDKGPRNYEHSIYQTVRKYVDTIWYHHYVDTRLEELFRENKHTVINFSQIEKSLPFTSLATIPPLDPYDLSTYPGALHMRSGKIPDLKGFQEKFPGVVVIDAATAPYWINKKKMSQLFTQNEELSQYKPRWQAYPKIYSPELAEKIKQEIPGDHLVIKPLSAFKGNGIIIFHKNQLDLVLKRILNKPEALKDNPSISFSHWAKDRSNAFIVEEFIESDTLIVPHLDNLPYDPTLRSVVALVFNKGEIEVQVFGMHWIIPKKSLADKGSMYERHRSAVRDEISSNVVVAKNTQELAKVQLERALTLLYQEMLGAP